MSNAPTSNDTMMINDGVPSNRDDIKMKVCESYAHHTLSRPTELKFKYENIWININVYRLVYVIINM